MKDRILTILALFLLTTSILVVTTAAQPNEKLPVIIGFKHQSDPKLVRAHGGEVTHTYTIITAVAAEIPQKAIDALRKNPNVAYVEMDQKVHALEDNLPWGVDRIDAEIVWGGADGSTDVTGNAGGGVQVAVVDTGINYNHPDLDDNYVDGYDFVNGDVDPLDDNGHGTHVSGTIAAEDNTEGVIGVAPQVGLYALKVLDQDGGGYLSDVVAGIEWAVNGPDEEEGNDDDAEVVSMSLGADSGATSLQEACDAAYASGTLLVAAAGNSGNPPGRGDNVGYPARYESVIAVAATDQNDKRARFSSTGPAVELAAPGVDITSTYLDGYVIASGTSMACPHVSGTAALVFAAGVSDPVTVRIILQNTAEDLGDSGRDNLYGYGLVDAKAAVDATGGGTTNSPPTADFTYTTSGLTVDFTDQSSDSDGTISSWSWNFGDGGTSTAQNPSHTYDSDGTYTVQLTVTDDGGATDSVSQDVSVSSGGTDGDSMYVYDISWKEAGPHLKSAVTILSDSGNPVSGANVDYTLTYPDGEKSTTYGVTDSNGQVEFMWKQVPSGEYIGEVTALTHNAYTWNSGLDVDNPDMYTK
ncbi:MAG: S8 family serine peptidase [Thermoproteota archaeon]